MKIDLNTSLKNNIHENSLTKTMKHFTFTKEQIVEKFVDVELPEEGYDNQGFYMGSEQRLRYVLVTIDMSPENTRDGGQLLLGQEDNKFYNCIEFWYGEPTYRTDSYSKVNNPEILQQLMDMDYDALEQYVCHNNFEWLGDDFDHMEEYLDFVSEMQDEWQFIKGDICNDSEYMEIIKKPWIRDKERGYKSDNKYEIAYKILLENALITNEIKKRLEAIGVN